VSVNLQANFSVSFQIKASITMAEWVLLISLRINISIYWVSGNISHQHVFFRILVSGNMSHQYVTVPCTPMVALSICDIYTP